jgi:hypothetical protein
MFEPEVIIVDEDSNICKTKLPVVAEILFNPDIDVIVVPKVTSVVPKVTLSFANFMFVTLPSAILAVVMFPS